MGKIIIFNVPAEKLGALSILNRVYNEAINDLENEYVFVLSGNYLKNEKSTSLRLAENMLFFGITTK